MIGVICKEEESRVVEEFFELFKTPWEFYVRHRVYEVVISTTDSLPSGLLTDALIIYNSKRVAFDGEKPIAREQRQPWCESDALAFPLYENAAVFESAEPPFLRIRQQSEVAGYTIMHPAGVTFRIGYDLFQEVSFLLSTGQPAENAHVPTLDLHIALLRKCILDAGVPVVEIPPVPAGYRFMACLTHDVDFTGIREHKFDHTMWGFLYRALISSTVNKLKGRIGWSRLFANWKAALSLPLVHLGLIEDFWLEFERFMQIERNFSSTFFFIPFKGVPGVGLKEGLKDSAPAPERRAAPYDFSKIKAEVLDLIAHGCEVGLHGLDAWHDVPRAESEAARIREVTGQPTMGVRMHWLYFAQGSPATLENAGFCYDSTFGYNDAVGFRAGTTQPFCPASTMDFLELPLTIQDTALFYPGRMNLSESQAMGRCERVIDSACQCGGVLTLNWHTRSLSPDRLWGEFYAELLKQISRHDVWFATARDIVGWFRNRRALRFEQVRGKDGEQMVVTGITPGSRPPFLLRIHDPKLKSATDSVLSAATAVRFDLPTAAS